MGVLHFLNVGQGDCSIIEHISGRVTVIDVCKARSPSLSVLLADALRSKQAPPNPFAGLGGGAPQPGSFEDGLLSAASQPTPSSAYAFAGLGGDGVSSHSALAIALRAAPSNELQAFTGPTQTENPIDYIKERGLTNVFRFILTHPEMDHMDGIKDLFDEFRPANFWDTDNSCTKSFSAGSRFREEDWTFYRGLRDGYAPGGVTRLSLYSGSSGPFYNRHGNAGEAQDGLHILAPTPSLIAEAKDSVTSVVTTAVIEEVLKNEVRKLGDKSNRR